MKYSFLTLWPNILTISKNSRSISSSYTKYSSLLISYKINSSPHHEHPLHENTKTFFIILSLSHIFWLGIKWNPISSSTPKNHNMFTLISPRNSHHTHQKESRHAVPWFSIYSVFMLKHKPEHPPSSRRWGIELSFPVQKENLFSCACITFELQFLNLDAKHIYMYKTGNFSKRGEAQ